MAFNEVLNSPLFEIRLTALNPMCTFNCYGVLPVAKLHFGGTQ